MEQLFSEAENRNHFILSQLMRIISGKYKEDVYLPKGKPVRPTTDMSKEALFNVINNHFSFEGLKILDLFSGTGNISYEFASRVAQPIISRWRLWLCEIHQTSGCRI
jgi:DNA modification methylase